MADNFNARLYARAYAPPVRGYAPPTRAPGPSGKPATSDPCNPACANCGLLECLCRPRFFAGQLLTEQDLNRLDAYIRAKNRLHTLQLHGWGVVNGLQVRCDPCGAGVVVGTGYAISPCGEDIIVCSDTTVDVCALIKQCRSSDVTCQPSSTGRRNCDDLVEDWVLAIRYSETPTKGVTALRMGSTCGCNSTGGTCSTTGTHQCGCGGATAKTTSTAPTHGMTSTTTQKPRGASPECEPTAVCESYSFDVYQAPEVPRDRPRRLHGALIDAFYCCVQPLIDVIRKPPAEPTQDNFKDPQLADKWTLWCCRVKDALIGWLTHGPQPDCMLLTKVSALVCPAPNSQDFATAMAQAYDQIQEFLVDATLACLCAALLPPAPFGTSDDRVPLAVVSVRKRDCKVLSICNWTPLRKLVLTFPTLEYWLGWIPWLKSLGEILTRLCCGEEEARVVIADPNERPRSSVPAAGASATLALNPALDADTAADNQTLTSLLQRAFARGDTPVDARAFVGAMFGFNAGSTQPLSANERANIAPFLLLNEVLRPIATTLPTDAGQPPLAVADSVTSGGTATGSLFQRIATLEARIAELEKRA